MGKYADLLRYNIHANRDVGVVCSCLTALWIGEATAPPGPRAIAAIPSRPRGQEAVAGSGQQASSTAVLADFAEVRKAVVIHTSRLP